MKDLLVAKVGSTLPALAAQGGDFEDWILGGMSWPAKRAIVVDVPGGADLPPCADLSGIVVSGSHANVTDHHDWSERLADWLAEAMPHRLPMLGICYGHQLLAYALGGGVGDNPHGLEFGTVDVHLTAAAGADPLFRGLPSPIQLQVSHRQSVLKLPPGARQLAFSAMDGHQAFVVGDCAWGLQFHPEFEAHVVRTYIGHFAGELRREGQDADRLAANCHDTAYGGQILRRFARLVAAG